MTSHISRFNWRIALLVFAALALLSFLTALFLLVSDDFVLGGKVVPASDPRILAQRIGASVACIVFAGLAWLCFRQNRKLS
jgi:hypothetical protein